MSISSKTVGAITAPRRLLYRYNGSTHSTLDTGLGAVNDLEPNICRILDDFNARMQDEEKIDLRTILEVNENVKDFQARRSQAEM